jgi:hypothetical protein
MFTLCYKQPSYKVVNYIPPPHTTTAPRGQGLFTVEALRSHTDTAHAVGLICTCDQPDAETFI